MKSQPSIISIFSILSIVILFFVNLSAYQMEGFTIDNLLMSLGVLIFLISHFMIILKVKEYSYFQILGIFLIGIYFLPQFVKLSIAVFKGSSEYTFTFVSFVLVFLMMASILYHSLKRMNCKS